MKEYDNLNKARQQLVEEIVNMTQLAIDDGEMEENITEILLGRLDRFEEEFIRAACTHTWIGKEKRNGIYTAHCSFQQLSLV